MSYSLHYFIRKTSTRYQLTQLAGNAGLHADISWVYLMEDIENTDFLRGGELVITTGMSIHSEQTLLAFAASLKRKQACGLLLNVGHYITKIPLSLISYCDENSLPLFTMPWKIHIADLMEQYCNEITIQRNIRSQIESAFEKLLFSSPADESALALLARYGCQTGDTYHITASRDSIPSATHSLPMNDLYYGIFFPGEFSDTPHPFSYGITVCNDLCSLYTAHRQAYEAYLVSRIKNQPVVSYEEIGLYRTVFSIPDTSSLIALSMPLLRPLLSYDKKHHTDYFSLLRLYLEHGKSVQAAAKVVYTHRNTVNYRIGKIKELLAADFDSLAQCCEYELAFHIYDVLSATAPEVWENLS